MKFSAILEGWRYGNPENIMDGVIVLNRRHEQKVEKPKPARKDDYYRQSRSIQLKEMVKRAKNG